MSICFTTNFNTTLLSTGSIGMELVQGHVSTAIFKGPKFESNKT